MRIVLDYIVANLKSKIFSVPERSFADWCTKRFGRTLSDLCFLHYTRKVWGRSPTELSSTLAKQKLIKLNLKDLIVKLIGLQGQEQPVYFREFYYPEQGIGQLWETLANDIRRHSGRIHLESRAAHIEPKEGQVTAVNVQNDTVKDFPDRQWIVSTIPITTLVETLRPTVPYSVQIAANSLEFRSLILFYLIVRRERVLQPQWIYFLDDEFTFNRVSDQKTLSEKMLAPGRTVLCMEKTCDFNDNIWNAPAEEHLAKALEELEQASLVSRDEVEGYHVAKIRYAYPLFNLDFENNLNAVIHYLAGVGKIISVGRPGLYLNNDMHDSMEMGIMAARYVLDGLAQDKTSRHSWYEQISTYKETKGW
jgi:protoporphyrinogen oxidase